MVCETSAILVLKLQGGIHEIGSSLIAKLPHPAREPTIFLTCTTFKNTVWIRLFAARSVTINFGNSHCYLSPWRAGEINFLPVLLSTLFIDYAKKTTIDIVRSNAKGSIWHWAGIRTATTFEWNTSWPVKNAAEASQQFWQGYVDRTDPTISEKRIVIETIATAKLEVENGKLFEANALLHTMK